MNNSLHIEAVEAAFNNFTKVNHTIVKHFGDANPAFILGYIVSQAKYYRELDKLDSQGYFWCKADKLQDMFGMSRKTQDTIIKKLEGLNLVSVINKTVNESCNPAKIRHLRVDYTAVHNFVNGIVAASKPVKEETLPTDLAVIKNTLKTFVESKGAKFFTAPEDEVSLIIARNAGFSAEVSLPLLEKRIKKWSHSAYNCKYLITSLMGNYKVIHAKIITPAIRPTINLLVA